MRKFILGFSALASLVLITSTVLGAISEDQEYLLNSHFGSVARQVQLGTKLQAVETTAEASRAAALASGKIWVGDGDGESQPVTVSGDITISNAGVGAIASDVVVNADVKSDAAIAYSKLAALTDGNILVGNGSNVATSVAVSGDATISNAGALTLAAGAVEQTMLAVPTSDGLNAHRVARFTYAPTGGTLAVGAHGLGVTLPAKAIIEKSFFIVETQLASAGNAATVALHCETADNIFAAADIDADSADTIKAGVSDGAVANMKQITSACEITATVAVEDLTAGKLVGFLTYVVTE